MITFHEMWDLPAPPPPTPAERVIFALRDGGMDKERAEQLVAELIAATVGGAA